jgi:hypothetical protein
VEQCEEMLFKNGPEGFNGKPFQKTLIALLG